MRANNETATRLGSSGDANDERNRLSVVRIAIMVATTAALAAMAPPGVTIAAFSSLAFISSVVIATFALLYRERMGAAHVTRWDEAAVMLAVSLGAGLFVDPTALEAAIAEAGQP